MTKLSLTFWLLLALGSLLAIEGGYVKRLPNNDLQYVENFEWAGNHATTQFLNGKPFTTVWWNEVRSSPPLSHASLLTNLPTRMIGWRPWIPPTTASLIHRSACVLIQVLSPPVARSSLTLLFSLKARAIISMCTRPRALTLIMVQSPTALLSSVEMAQLEWESFIFSLKARRLHRFSALLSSVC